MNMQVNGVQISDELLRDADGSEVIDHHALLVYGVGTNSPRTLLKWLFADRSAVAYDASDRLLAQRIQHAMKEAMGHATDRTHPAPPHHLPPGRVMQPSIHQSEANGAVHISITSIVGYRNALVYNIEAECGPGRWVIPGPCIGWHHQYLHGAIV